MSHTLTAVPANNPSTISAPDPGNLADANQAAAAWQACLDKAAHANWPEADASKTYQLSSRVIIRCQSAYPTPNVDTGSFANQPSWAPNAAGLMAQTWIANTHNVTPTLYQPLDMPNGSTLTAVTVYLQAHTVHSALPTLPTLAIWKVAVIGGAATQLGVTTTDTSPDVSTYETSHPVSVPDLTEVIDKTAYRYFAILVGESGASFGVAGLLFSGAFTQSTVTFQDPGAA